MATEAWQSAFIEANGLRLHYTRTGGGKPPVVLAHGFSDNGLCWTPVAEALQESFDVVMPDARGHGLSDAPESGYGPVEMADDLAGLIMGLGLQRPALLGHSMGAVSVLVLAGRNPELAGAILLEDPPPWWLPGPTPFGDEWRSQTHNWLDPLRQMTQAELIAHQRVAEPGWQESELAPWAESKLQMSPNVLNRSLPPAVDWPAVLGRVACPTLLITGDPERNAILTPALAASLQARVPQTQIAHIPNAGHSIRRDQFERYMEVVRAFL